MQYYRLLLYPLYGLLLESSLLLLMLGPASTLVSSYSLNHPHISHMHNNLLPLWTTMGSAIAISMRYTILTTLPIIINGESVATEISTEEETFDICTNGDNDDNDNCHDSNNNVHQPHQQQRHKKKNNHHIFPDCQLYLAPSTLVDNSSNDNNPNNRFGVFATNPTKRGRPITITGDVVIQFVDPPLSYNPLDNDDNNNDMIDDGKNNLLSLLERFGLYGPETGGQYEGKNVVSIIPGIGSIANIGNDSSGSQKKKVGVDKKQTKSPFVNVLPYQVEFDEADQSRYNSPSAGSFSHYHNYTWFFLKDDINTGNELFVGKRGRYQWKDDGKKEDEKVKENEKVNEKEKEKDYTRNPEWLHEHGYCLDNLHVGTSTLPLAGRGTFASRFLPQGSIVAPVPVMLLDNDKSLLMNNRKKTDDQGSKGSHHDNNNNGNSNKEEEEEEKWQLLLNYCFGHVNSSILLFPYSPMVNLINHAPPTPLSSSSASAAPRTRIKQINHDGNEVYANVGLRWSESSSSSSFTNHHSQYSDSNSNNNNQEGEEQLLLEYFALRDIRKGEEIVFDYGYDWENAWNEHVTIWNERKKNMSSSSLVGHVSEDQWTSSYVMDDAIALIRTEKEQREHPYPDHLTTSCYYYYEGDDSSRTTSSSSRTKMEGNRQNKEITTTTIKWKMTRQTFQYSNLRPCTILKRNPETFEPTQTDVRSMYTVLMKNRWGMYNDQKIPLDRLDGGIHIVRDIPREAIRFTHKLYTTDQHLDGAFRRRISLPDDIFPKAWK